MTVTSMQSIYPFAFLLSLHAWALSAGAAVAILQPQRIAHRVTIPASDPLADPLKFSSAERQAFTEATDGQLDEDSLLDAALVACGTDDSAIRICREIFADALTDIRSLARSASSDLDRVELVHRMLHQRLLGGGYDANATDLADTLRTGIYNCASATVLWIALAKELNIDAHAVEMPGHVRVVVRCDGQLDEIEATCPRWPEAIRRLPRGSDGVHAAGTRQERVISTSGLIAMIYYNRGIDAFNDRRYAEAVVLNRKALVLDGENQTARGNLLAAINNWALSLADAGQLDAAETLLAAGRRFDPNHAAFVHNAAHIQQLRFQSQSPAASAASKE